VTQEHVTYAKGTWLFQFPGQIFDPELILALFFWAQSTCDLWAAYPDWHTFLEKGTAKTIKDMQETLIYAHQTLRKHENPFQTPVRTSSVKEVWYDPEDDDSDEPPGHEPPDPIIPVAPAVKEEPPDEQGGLSE
jgi:hypothetical protein